MQSKSIRFIQSVCRGIGQIMLQENAITGVLFLAGIFCDSVLDGVAVLLATIVGTTTAVLLKYDEKEIEQGLYGFSAALVGAGMMAMMQPIIIVWIAIVVGSILATMLQHFFIKKKLPGFTFPFILVTWILMYVFHHVLLEGNVPMPNTEPLNDDGFDIGIHGFGEVIFQDSIISGILFFIGVFINRPIAALYGVLGAVISAYVAVHFSEPNIDVDMGLFSFNALLCAITFADDKPVNGVWVLFSVLLSVLIDIEMLKMGWSVLTFPFVLSCWITLSLQKLIPSRFK